ncbi:MAG TPA: toxin HicA [Cytophagales bacterium]|jgi:hypothetical protein|nr:toxin HicA [Cytophagales bacterium]
MKHRELTNPKNVKFKDLLKICEEYFGEYRISGDHYIFRMPWAGDPYVNLQPDKKNSKMAKPYQVKQVLRAIRKIEENEHGND